jgi:hypothetical protein
VRLAVIIAVSAAVFLATMAAPCPAQEPVGCDKFKWPLDKERATLTGTDLPKLRSGERVTWPVPWAAIVALVPFADANLPMAPGRQPKSPTSFAGFVEVPAPPRAGIYKTTLSSEGWIDVVQGGRALKAVAFTGATGCDGVRKSVKFDLAPQPLIIELSGAPANSIAIVVNRE